MDVLKQKVSKLKPLLFRGLSTDIVGNVQLISDDTLLHPIGKIIIIYNISSHSQQYIKLPRSEKTINLITISPDRKYIAVAEKHGSPRFSVYDVHTRKRLKLLGNPIKNCTCEEFVALTFTHDSKYIVGVVGQPDWFILYYNWQKGRVESHAKAIYSNNKGTVHQICANPEDKAVVVVVGEGLYRQMSVTERIWRQYGFQRAESIPLRSACWLNVETVLAGSADGRLILVRSSELRAVYQAHKVVEIEFQAINESQKSTISLASNTVTPEEKSGIYEVRCLIAFSRGFAFSCFSGIVTIFEKISSLKYVRKNVVRVISPGVGDMDHVTINQIRHISVSPSEKTMAVTTFRTELYITKILVDQDIDKVPYLHFQALDNGFHHGPIASISTCVWKPLFITVGALDKTARIWDYDTRKSILIKDFPNEIYSASFHPCGLYCLMGFTDKLKLLLVLTDDLRAVRQVDIKCCPLVSFSYGGNLFAAVNGERIEVYSAIYFNRLYVLEDHQEPIRSILFTYDDYSLYVCDGNGYMFKWELAFQKRLDGYTSMGSYCDIACTKDGLSCCTVSTDGTLKEAVKGEVSRMFRLEEASLNSLVMSNSNEMLVIGSETGTIYSVLYPLIHPPIYLEFYIHTAPVKKIIIGPRDTRLISVSSDGSLCIWSVLNVNKQCSNDFKNITDILVSVNDYNDKNNVIKDLGARLNEIETEHAYIVQQITAGHEAALKEFHKGYLSTIEDLKFKIKQIDREHLVEMNEQHTKMDQMVTAHGQQMEEQNKFYTAKLIEEYEKYEAVEQKSKDTMADCHKQILEIKVANEDVIKEIVREKDELITKSLQQIKKLETEIIEIKQIYEQLKSDVSRHVEEEVNRVNCKFSAIKEKLDKENHQLMCENGIKMKQAIKYLEEIDSYKTKVVNLESEMDMMKKTELNLVQEVKVLKAELAERDWTINEKDKIIIKVTERNQELSKKKFVLSSRIEALENKLAPKGDELADHQQTMDNLMGEIAQLKANVENKDFQIDTLKRRLLANLKELEEQKCKTQTAMYWLKVIKNEVFRAKQVMFDYCKLKRIVMDMYSKYDNKSTMADFQTSKLIETEFITQKRYLESIIAKLNGRIKKLNKQQSPVQTHLLNQNKFLLKELLVCRQEMYRLKKLQSVSAAGAQAKEIERARMRPPTSVPKTYNTYIGSGTAIFHPDKIPMGLQPQNTLVSQTRLSTGRVVKVQSERIVRDKKYYEEVLRVKINQLNNGLEIMNANMEQSMKDMGSYQYYKAIVKELASSLTELQGRLADHNMALQKVNVGSDPAKTLAEARELASVNSAEEAALEVLFTDRVRREEASQVLQNQLTKEIHKTDQMIANMNPAMKQRYNDLMKGKTEMQQRAEQLKEEIEAVGKMMCVLSDQVYVSPLKMELFESEVKLWDMHNKRNNLMLETKGNLEPEDEFKSLLSRIKEDKVQMSTMEKAINEIKEEIKQGETVLMHLEEKNVDEARNVAKYLELHKKELAMDDFLSSVEGRREDELNSLRALDAQILPLLKNLSARLSTIPTLADYKSVSTSQIHVVKRDLLNTVKSVGSEFTSLFRYLNKIVKMGSKVEEDLNKLTKNTETMSSEMETYSDTADLETKIKQKQDELTAERDILTTARLSTKSSVNEATANFNEIQRQLSESERYAQLLFIEKKLLNLAHSNYAINEYLEEAKSDGYLEERRDKALHTLQILNHRLRNNATA